MTASVRAVVFDVGGVLLGWDPRALYRKLIPGEQAMEAFLAEVCTPAWNLEQDRGRSWDEGVAELVYLFPQHADLIRAYRDRWNEMLTGPIGGTIRLLARLDEANVPCYALTNFSRETFPGVRARHAFFARFKGIVVSGDEGVAKPEPAIYRRLTDRYGLDPQDLLFIDDVEGNLEGARAQGWHTHLYQSPELLEAELVRRGLL